MSEITVEVAYALPHKQSLKALIVASDATALMAIEQSGILKEFPEIDLAKNKVGIFGKAIRKIEEHALTAGDRLEIYRPLLKKKTVSI